MRTPILPTYTCPRQHASKMDPKPRSLTLTTGTHTYAHRLELAFNGVGFYQENPEPKYGKGLSQCLRENVGAFDWVSHTWTHQHLDWLNGDECKGKESMCGVFLPLCAYT